jgi:hypothetical protein
VAERNNLLRKGTDGDEIGMDHTRLCTEAEGHKFSVSHEGLQAHLNPTHQEVQVLCSRYQPTQGHPRGEGQGWAGHRKG